MKLEIIKDAVDFFNMFDEPLPSEQQLNMMLHAIGADSKDCRKYRDNLIYHAYRNYYDAGGDNVELWEDLVKRQLATKNKSGTYRVSVSGLYFLGNLTNATIFDNRHTVADARRNVLKIMMECDAYCGYQNWLPTSAKYIASRLAIPVKLVRQTLNELAENGYVKKGYDGGIDEYREQVYCVHGWYCTEKTRQMEQYKEIQKAEYDRINAMMKEEAVEEQLCGS